MPQPKLFRVIDRAVHDYRMIEDGDRILIGASGGKDSTALVEYFANRKKRVGAHFEFEALHIASGIGSPLAKELVANFESWGVSVATETADVLARLKEGQKMNCWWCSLQRRTELTNYAMEHGFNKIALGHHMDDILETLLMNALGRGELSTMPPRLKYEKYPITIIRPLCMADEKTIIAHVNERGYAKQTCTCTYQDNSGRKEARKRLADLTKGNATEKRRLFEALKNVKMDYLTYPPCDK